MTLNTPTTLSMALIGALLVACSNGSDIQTQTQSEAQTQAKQHQYMIMDKFDHDLAKFVGLNTGESLEQSEEKIHAVFKAYDGHATPLDISMDALTVDADWKQVLVTQDGLMDGTVTGQQLLAIFDESDTLISYGIRIKCHSETGTSDWQTALCE